MKKPTFEDVRDIAADVLQVSPRRITRESSVETIETWDSLHHLSLILALENSFGFQFEPEEMERMTSLEQILSVLEEKPQTE